MYTLRALALILFVIAGSLMFKQVSPTSVSNTVASEKITPQSLSDEEYIEKYLTYPDAIPMKKFNTEYAIKTSAKPEEVYEWYQKQFKKIGYPHTSSGFTDPTTGTIYFVQGQNQVGEIYAYIGKLTYEDSTFIEFNIDIRTKD